MKRAFFFIMIALLGIIYYAAGKPMEIADRVMVHAIGIDETAEGCKVTMQIFSPSDGGSETAIDPSQPNVSLIKGKGGSVSEAVHDCEKKLGGRIFIGQNRIILFGRNTDLSRTDELFGFFLSSSEAYLNTDCAAAESTAEKLLSEPIPSSSISSEKFVMMINSECERGCAVRCSLMQLMEAMGSGEKCVMMPQFSAQQTKSGGKSDNGGEQQPSEKLTAETGIMMGKAAVFRDGRFCREITGEKAGIIGMINGSGSSVYTEAEQGGRRLGKTYRAEARSVSAAEEDGKLVVRIRCSTEPLDEQYFPNSRERAAFNDAAREKLSREAEETAAELCAEGLYELLGAEAVLRRYFPALLREKGSAEELYGRLRYKITVC